MSRRRILAVGAVAPFAAAAGPLGGGVPARVGGDSRTDPADLTLVEILPRLTARRLSARELVDACIARAERYDRWVRAFRLPTFDRARDGAARTDQDRARGRPVGPLAGVPIGVKDTLYTDGIRTTACSNALSDFVPDHDSAPWARLVAAGAVLLGKLNCTEFAYGTGGSPTRNP